MVLHQGTQRCFESPKNNLKIEIEKYTAPFISQVDIMFTES